MATFITSKSVGESVSIYAETTTGYWQAIHDGTTYGPFNQDDNYQSITISNTNGEFTVQSCDSNGDLSGDITALNLDGNQITSFDGTGLSGLTILNIANNQLTSLDGSLFPESLTHLSLGGNQLTSLEGFVFPVNLTHLYLGGNQLTSFNGYGLVSLTTLLLSGNQLTSLTNVNFNTIRYFYVINNPICTPTFNNEILFQLVQNELENGNFLTSNGRTSAGTADYDTLISRGWNLQGLDLPEETTTTTTTTTSGSNPTFVTSKSVGESVSIYAETTTGYWIAIHDGTTYGPYGVPFNPIRFITITNANGEFTLQSCDSEGNVSGDITVLSLSDNLLTSFDGSGLSGLTNLNLGVNGLTELTLSDLTSLIQLVVGNNPLTTISISNSPLITDLGLSSFGNNTSGKTLTSVTLSGLDSLKTLYLDGNLLTSLDVSGITSLLNLYLRDNGITSLSGFTFPNSLTSLVLSKNQLTSISSLGLTNLSSLDLSANVLVTYEPIPESNDLNTVYSNLLTSFDGSDLINLQKLILNGNVISSLDNFIFPSSLNELYLGGARFSDNIEKEGVAFNVFNYLQTFNVSGLPNLQVLNLGYNQLTSFNAPDSHILTRIDLSHNGITSLTEFNFPTLEYVVEGQSLSLLLNNNNFTTFDGTNLPIELGILNLQDNPNLSSVNVLGLTNLIGLFINCNDEEGSGREGTRNMEGGRPDGGGVKKCSIPITPEMNDQILSQLVQNNASLFLRNVGDQKTGFFSLNGRTSASTSDYNTLIGRGWTLVGVDLPEETTTTTTTTIPFGSGLVLKSLPYGDGNPVNRPLTLNELEGNFAYLNSCINTILESSQSMEDRLLARTSDLASLDDLITAIENGETTTTTTTEEQTTTTTTTVAEETTTTTTTENPWNVYDFSSFDGSDFSRQFTKYGITNWDGTYRIVATDLNIGTNVYYIGTDGDKHLMSFEQGVSQGSAWISINSSIYEKVGTITFDSITPFVATTTTTTTEEQTTTTTTTEGPNFYIHTSNVVDPSTASFEVHQVIDKETYLNLGNIGTIESTLMTNEKGSYYDYYYRFYGDGETREGNGYEVWVDWNNGSEIEKYQAAQVVSTTTTTTTEEQTTTTTTIFTEIIPGSIVSNGLVLHFDIGSTDCFDGGSTIYDLSGNGYTGLINGATYNSENGGNLYFNGSSYVSTDYVVQPINQNVYFTWEAWIKINAGGVAPIIGNRDNYSLPTNFIKLQSSTFEYYPTSGSRGDVALNLPSGSWIQVVAVKDANTNRCYVNGQYVNQATNVGDILDTNPFFIGGDPGANELSQSNVSIVRIYNRALREEEILHNYQVIRNSSETTTTTTTEEQTTTTTTTEAPTTTTTTTEAMTNYLNVVTLDSITDVGMEGASIHNYMFTINPDLSLIQSDYNNQLVENGGNKQIVAVSLPPNSISVDVNNDSWYELSSSVTEFPLYWFLRREGYYNTYGTYDMVFKTAIFELVDGNYNFVQFVGQPSQQFSLEATSM